MARRNLTILGRNMFALIHSSRETDVRISHMTECLSYVRNSLYVVMKGVTANFLNKQSYEPDIKKHFLSITAIDFHSNSEYNFYL